MAKARILVVDDDSIVASTVEAMLQDLGYTVPAIASSGRDAIREVKDIQPDLVLMDIYLKGDMDGIQTAEQIHTHCDIPVVYITGYADEETLQRAKVTEPYGYILKPFQDKDLHTAIEIALYKHEAKQALAEKERLQHEITERKKAEEASREIDRMKSEFISNVSHELRSPLHSIQGFTRLMLEGKVPDPETQREFLTTVDKQSEHLGSLIDSLLDISRLESGRFNIQKQRLPIKNVIHDAVESSYSLASEKGILINEDIPSTLPEIEGDGERLGQVMANLLGNAIKFSNGGNSITVRAEVRDRELLVQVADLGIGIPRKAMPHLFERFYRAQDLMARGGAGLGLYISKQIIEAHGGRIWVESTVDEGSTFSFTLPLNPASPSPEKP